MIGILVMLNNYFHDFATALVVVSTYGMLFLVKHAERKGGRELKETIIELYPKMVHLTGGSVVFVFVAGIVRSFTYKDYEWHDATASGQVAALMVKHAILFVIFAYGIYLWIKVHRKVSAMRKEISRVEA